RRSHDALRIGISWLRSLCGLLCLLGRHNIISYTTETQLVYLVSNVNQKIRPSVACFAFAMFNRSRSAPCGPAAHSCELRFEPVQVPFSVFSSLSSALCLLASVPVAAIPILG